MTIIVSVGGLVTDWSVTNQAGDYAAWLESPFSQPALTTIMAARDGSWPIGTGVQYNVTALPPIHIQIMDEANEATLRPALLRALDTSQAFKALIVADDDGDNERYWMCSFQAKEERDEAGGTGMAFVVSAVVVGDPYPRAVTTGVEAASMNGTGQTENVTNSGKLDAYPVIQIEPTVERVANASWVYRRFAVVRWRAANSVRSWPVQISGDGDDAWDTTVITPGKALDETSVAVFVDGAEVDRWFNSASYDPDLPSLFDKTNTAVWANLDFQAGLSVTLSAALGDTEADVEAGLTVDEDISAFPPAGILYAPAENELFYYLSKDVLRRTFNGVTRAVYESSAASHAAGDTLEWIQHEIFLAYQPQYDVAKVADPAARPLIETIFSDNTTWLWNGIFEYATGGFGSTEHPLRPAGWTPVTSGNGTIFTQYNDGIDTDPFVTMGMSIAQAGEGNMARWQIYIPVPTDGYVFDGLSYEGTEDEAVKVLGSRDGSTWTELYTAAAGTVDWDNWVETVTDTAMPWRYYAVQVAGFVGIAYLQTVSVDFPDDTRAASVLMPEVANYALNMTVTNEATEESFQLVCPAGLSVGDTVTVDTEARTVTATPMGRNVYNILTKSSFRQHVLRLQPGLNTIRVDEAGLEGIIITISWVPRFYS